MGSGLTKLLPPPIEDGEEDVDHPLGKKPKKGKNDKNESQIIEAPKGKKKGKEKDEVLVMDERLFYVINSLFFIDICYSYLFDLIIVFVLFVFTF